MDRLQGLKDSHVGLIPADVDVGISHSFRQGATSQTFKSSYPSWSNSPRLCNRRVSQLVKKTSWLLSCTLDSTVG